MGGLISDTDTTTLSWRDIIVPWAITRGLQAVVAWLTLWLAPSSVLDVRPRAFPGVLIVDGWVRWDSFWYWSLARDGYTYLEGAQSNVAFFPLYPYLSLGTSLPFRLVLDSEQAFFVVALAISFAAFLVACWGVFVLAEDLCGRRVARWAVWLLCAVPFGYFFNAAYAESLFLAMCVWSFVLASRGHWFAAFVLAAGCAVTRAPGFIVAVGLTALAVVSYSDPRDVLRSRTLGYLALPISALAAFMAYLWIRFGDPLVFMSVQDEWGRSLALQYLVDIRDLISASSLDAPTAFDFLQLAAFVGGIALTVVAWRRLGVPYGLFCALSLVVVASGGFNSTGRYLAVVFPLYIAAALIIPSVRALVAVVSSLLALQVVLVAYFANWGAVW